MKYNSRTITLTTDAVHDWANVPGAHYRRQANTIYNERETKAKAEALAVLLGEYNKYARHVDVDKYEALKERHDRLVQEMITLMNN